MDREYLENYQAKEEDEYRKLVLKRIDEGKFEFEKDRYPPDNRFIKLQTPVARVSTGASSSVWAQVPFCGSLILTIPPYPQEMFEKVFFKVSEISNVIDFIKDTGRLQISLSTGHLTPYSGLDYLDPFFEELKPPFLQGFPWTIFGDEKENEKAFHAFMELSHIKYHVHVKEYCEQIGTPDLYIDVLSSHADTYCFLKLGHYSLAEDIENLMVDDPIKAHSMLLNCTRFIRLPVLDQRCNSRNFTISEIRGSQTLPHVYKPSEIDFPCEIGKFLLRKLTYAAQDMRACYELIDHYDSQDLRKIQTSLNDAIVANHPDIVSKNAEELAQILDNIWADRAIPKKVENIKAGVPISIAAIGGVAGALVAGPVGAGLGGFLAGLGFKVAEKGAEKFYAIKGEKLSENLAKFRTKSYQANIYDFKEKYKTQLTDRKG